MAEVKGNLVVKDKLTADGNARFNGGVDSPYLEIRDKKNSDGGTFTAGAWKNRDLNETIHNDFASSITLSAEHGDNADFTIPAGTYQLEADCAGFEVEKHMARLADVTDVAGASAPTVVLGTLELSPDTSLWEDGAMLGLDPVTGTPTRSKISGRFAVTRATTLEIQHWGEVSQAGDGFGASANFYTTTEGYIGNVYTTLRMWQVIEGG